MHGCAPRSMQPGTARMQPLMLLSSSRVFLQLGTARMHPLMLLSSSRVLLQQGTAPLLDALSSEAEAASQPLPRLAPGRGSLTVRIRPQGGSGRSYSWSTFCALKH